MHVDFVDINMGCPIDVVCNKGCGAQLATLTLTITLALRP